jgi:SAM-dependent methyltransferase
MPYLTIDGDCPICEQKVTFTSEDPWLRDHFPVCQSIPRERALMQVINDYFPNYRKLRIHESSPCERGVSAKLRKECPAYSMSHYFADIVLGKDHPTFGCRNENLESLSYPANEFDLFLTQDVMEHIYNPEKAFSEINRVLAPGGAHIFTVPLINKSKKPNAGQVRMKMASQFF